MIPGQMTTLHGTAANRRAEELAEANRGMAPHDITSAFSDSTTRRGTTQPMAWRSMDARIRVTQGVPGDVAVTSQFGESLAKPHSSAGWRVCGGTRWGEVWSENQENS